MECRSNARFECFLLCQISRLVVRDFEEDDKGTYTCGQRSDDGSATSVAASAKVYLMMRPRLLADYVALLQPSSENGLLDDGGGGGGGSGGGGISATTFGGSTSAVSGHRVSFPLEEGFEGRLVCSTNPNFAGPIRVTWFYHGRQLIAPAAAMLEHGGCEIQNSEGEMVSGSLRGGPRGRHGKSATRNGPPR